MPLPADRLWPRGHRAGDPAQLLPGYRLFHPL